MFQLLFFKSSRKNRELCTTGLMFLSLLKENFLYLFHLTSSSVSVVEAINQICQNLNCHSLNIRITEVGEKKLLFSCYFINI